MADDKDRVRTRQWVLLHGESSGPTPPAEPIEKPNDLMDEVLHDHEKKTDDNTTDDQQLASEDNADDAVSIGNRSERSNASSASTKRRLAAAKLQLMFESQRREEELLEQEEEIRRRQEEATRQQAEAERQVRAIQRQRENQKKQDELRVQIMEAEIEEEEELDMESERGSVIAKGRPISNLIPQQPVSSMSRNHAEGIPSNSHAGKADPMARALVNRHPEAGDVRMLSVRNSAPKQPTSHKGPYFTTQSNGHDQRNDRQECMAQRSLDANATEHETTPPAAAFESSMLRVAQYLSHAVERMDNSHNCPKQVLQAFSGRSADFPRFLHSFESTVETAKTDNRARLNLLIQYCQGDARLLIEDCVNLDPKIGYEEAKKLLKKRYGQPWQIAEQYLQSMTEGPPIKASDHEGLAQLSLRMQKCRMNLSSMEFSAEIDNTETLRRIVRRLPYKIKEKWAEISHAIMVTKKRPAKFDELAEFVETQYDIAFSIFGREAQSTNRANQTRDQSLLPRAKQATALVSTQQQSPQKCAACQGDCAELAACQIFVGLTLTERWQLVKQCSLCFCCLRRGHALRSCRQRKPCAVDGCRRSHHQLLHSWYTAPANAVMITEDEHEDNEYVHAVDAPEALTSVSSAQTHAATGRINGAYLGIVPVTIHGPNGALHTCALLDNGSTQSFINEDLRQRLGLQGKPLVYSVSTLTSKDSQNGHSVDFKISSPHCPNGTLLTGVWTSHSLKISCRNAATSADVSQFSHLADLTLPSHYPGEVQLLIGANSGLLTPLEVRVSQHPELPYAERTSLGWVVRGPTGRSTTGADAHFLQSTDPEHDIRRIWDTDFMELSNRDKKSMSVEDKRALNLMDDSIRVVDGHYEIALPWGDEDDLPCNKAHAAVRLKHVRQRLTRDPELHRKYCNQMDEYLKAGYAREISEEPTHSGPRRTWYLPHHPVHNDKKPDRVRVVFDGAAKFHGTALNNHLLQGPDLVNNLPGVLMRFRKEPIALIADISAMFHQVLTPRRDQDSLRFLWWPRGDLTAPPADYCMTRHVFGLRSSPSCAAFALLRTAADYGKEFDEKVTNYVQRNFYVDDLLLSVPTTLDAEHAAHDLTALLKRGGFTLTKWSSNSRQVLQCIPSEIRAQAVQNLVPSDCLPGAQTLGLLWEPDSDYFRYSIQMDQKPSTKRGILSTIASIYDPLGLLSPTMLDAKLILQDLTKSKIGWDDPIPPDSLQHWTAWCDRLSALQHLRIPRVYDPCGTSKAHSLQLHVFGDASERGIGVCAYLRMDTTDGVSCALIAGKSRLAPIKPTTIPRLELTAAMVASRVKSHIVEELDVGDISVTMWTDSAIVLAYIKNTKSRFKPFIANRLTTIHDLTSPDEWRHVPTKYNPADLASRGFGAQDKGKMATWISGPAFLLRNENSWPCSENPIESTDLELEVHAVDADVCMVDDCPLLQLTTRYSTWQQSVTCTAWWLRYRRLLRFPTERTPFIPLAVQEMKTAELTLLAAAQRRHYSREIRALQQHSRVPSTSRILELNPFLSDGDLLLADRRTMPKSGLIILPYKDPVTSRIIANYHEKNGHVGPEQVLAYCRERYWIVKGRSAVRSVLSKCITCRRHKAKLAHQQMAPLLTEQVAPCPAPFTFVGVDFFGPFLVKQGRSHVKRYGCLFTCITMRAVHIEVAHSLTTDSFLSALTRFIARRGKPTRIFSDRGTNLTSTDKELRQGIDAFDAARIGSALRAKNIEWSFNPPHASHRGGLWERLIRSVRAIMRTIIGQQSLTDESLATLFAEIERILNDRPLTQVSDDARDPEPLSPAQLLLLRGAAGCTPLTSTAAGSTHAQRWWRHAQVMSDAFWKRWLREYIPKLMARQKWQTPQPNIKRGDLVLIADYNRPRGSWPLGIIEEVYIGRDGLVRSAAVRTSANNSLKRPVTQLCVLEGATS